MKINYLLGKIKVANAENVSFIKNMIGKEIEKKGLYSNTILIYEFIKMLDTYRYYEDISFFTELLSFNDLKNINECKTLHYIILSNTITGNNIKNLELLDKIDVLSANESYRHRIIVNFIASLTVIHKFSRALALLNSFLESEKKRPFLNIWLGRNYSIIWNFW